MERAAVELNGQALLAPQAIDLEALDPPILSEAAEGGVRR
jgi:hypothetical protein